MPVLGQIRRWLMQPNLWRFLSFLSTVIGLVCYARSSPFNHLFKKWNFFKFFVYIVISFIICLIVLFAKVWQRLRSHLVKAHLTVTIFTGSSVYSFFFEKALKGKPDVYSLISCAAFAIMSLSLSRQSHCGFEVDLLYFFLGCLFVLLTKIHLLLAIFGGGGFAYCLTMLRYSLDAQRPQPEDVDLEQGLVGDSQQANTGSPLLTIPHQANTDSAALMTFDAPPQNGHLELQDHGVTQIDSHSQPANTGSPLHTIPQQANTDSAPLMTFDAPPQNEYLELQDHGVTQVDSHSQPDDGSVFNISKFRDMVMAEYKHFIKVLKRQNQNVKEMLFEHVVEYLSANVAQLRTDPNLVIDVLRSEFINKLHQIVELMVASGIKEEQCCQTYISWRREFLEEFLSFIMVEQFNTEDVDVKNIQRWIKASNIAVQILFPNERTLCDRVFSGFSSIADLSFTEVCKELTNRLLDFANTIAITSRLSSNHLLSIVRMFERLRDFIPELQSVFYDQCRVLLRNEAIMIWKKSGRCSNDVVHLDLATSSSSSSSFSIDLDESMEARIQRLISEHPVIIFGRSSCCMCHVMKRLLDTIGVNPTVIELDDHEIAALPHSSSSDNHETTTTAAAIRSSTPVVFIGGTCVGGLESFLALHISGHLVPKLVEVGALRV